MSDETDETTQWRDWRRRHQQERAPAHLRANLERAYRLRYAGAPVRGRWGMSVLGTWRVAAAASAMLVLVVLLRTVGPPSMLPARALTQGPSAAVPVRTLSAPAPREVARAVEARVTTTHDLAVADHMTVAPATQAAARSALSRGIAAAPSLAALPTAPTMPSAPSFSMPGAPAFSSLHMPSLPPMPRASTAAPQQLPARDDVDRDTGRRATPGDATGTV